MTQFFEVPLVPAQAQRVAVQLGAQTYQFTLYWCVPAQVWVLDLADQDNVLIAAGIPLITGAYLLEQLAYLGIPGDLVVQTSSTPDAVPTFENLGVTGHLYYRVDDAA